MRSVVCTTDATTISWPLPPASGIVFTFSAATRSGGGASERGRLSTHLGLGAAYSSYRQRVPPVATLTLRGQNQSTPTRKRAGARLAPGALCGGVHAPRAAHAQPARAHDLPLEQHRLQRRLLRAEHRHEVGAGERRRHRARRGVAGHLEHPLAPPRHARVLEGVVAPHGLHGERARVVA